MSECAHRQAVQVSYPRALCNAVGGEHAFFLASGGSVAHDYGHLDYALGEHASEELFPRIEAWLRRR